MAENTDALAAVREVVQTPSMTNVSAWMGEVREKIDARLRSYLDSQLDEVKGISPDSAELVNGVRELTLRGGKRLRPVALSAAYSAVKPEGSLDDTIDAGCALEILQSYLLIHDDWMDQDDERRGGPAIHRMYRDDHPRHLADSLAILAGDLGCGMAWELILNAPFPASRRSAALRQFVQIQKEVYYGQHLDLTANADVSRMHDLKTGSYTVRGPLLIGAHLGDASEEQVEALLAFGNPIGEAFQLADDLLGTFGDTDATGKPGNDLRHGKRTCLVAEVEKLLPQEDRTVLDRVMQAEAPHDADVAAAMELIVSSGAKKNVEDRLETLLAQAISVLEDAPLDDLGVATLKHVADRLAVRKK